MMPKDLSDAFLLLGKSTERKLTFDEIKELTGTFSYYLLILNQKQKTRTSFVDEYSLENAYKHSMKLLQEHLSQ